MSDATSAGGMLPDDDELLAAELALGLLDDAERTAALARVERDPAFARSHTRWQAHAATLLDGVDEAPRPEVWAAIAARLPANDDQRTYLSRPSHAPPQRWWQAATAASLVAAVGLGLVALGRPDIPAPVIVRPVNHVTMVAVLTGKDGGALAVTYDATARRLITAPAGLQGAGLQTEGRSTELWAIPAGSKPISLGVVPAGAASAVAASEQARRAIADDITLAVSVEPRGGSPTGQPTGPVILTGTITTS